MEVTRVDNPLKMFYSEGSYEGVDDECEGGIIMLGYGILAGLE